MTKRLDIEVIINNVKMRNYIFMERYFVNNVTRIKIKDEFGYKYDVDYQAFVKNHIPRFVHINNPNSLENISIWLIVNNKSFELCDGNKYLGSDKDLNFYCFNCESVFVQDWECMLAGFSNCSICSGHQVGEKTCLAYLRSDLVEQWIKSKHNKTPNDVTEFSHENVLWKCKDCDHKW